MADTKNFLDKTGLQRLVTNLKNLFLSKTNTTQYTPTANYHPATKKYVDDNKYTLPTASSSTKGGIKVGTNLTIADGVLSATDTTYSAATTSAAGLMSASDKSKLDGIATGANKYSLPTASASTLGGIKVGSNLSINNGVLSATNTTYGAATTDNAGLMSAADKSKLDGIASGANAYSLPTATSSVLGGVKVGSNINLSSGTISLTKANVTSALGYTPPTTNTTYNNASTTAAGLMSASDKSKLDGIASGANAYSLPTASASTLGGIKVGTNLSISNGVLSATNTTYSAATTSAAGLMSAADKTKLNGIATGATANSASTTTPKANGTASTGSESGYSRGDHVHPAQTTVSGNAGSATKLQTARKINGVSFNGTADITVADNTKLPLTGGHMTGYTMGFFPATANTMVGNEYNILLNGGDRYTFTESGTGTLGSTAVKGLFNGAVAPVYSADGIDPSNPYVLLIENLPNVHTQTGGVFGWTSRYWYPKTYKIEFYDTYNNKGWRTIKDVTNVATKELVIPFNPNGIEGSFTKIRITIKEAEGGSTGANGFRRWGLSEIFFCHPEAITAYQYAHVAEADTATSAAAATKVNNNLVVKLNSGSTEGTNLFTFNGSAAKTVNITASSIGAAASSHGTHVTWSTTTPKANGTAAVGTETKVARGDHVHPLQTSVSGNAGTATKFASAQSVALTGDVTGSASSQAGWSVATTLANSGVTAGSYGPSANATPAYGATFNVPYITVDAKGRVTSASTKTVKIPASDNSDTKVTNTLATTTKAYVTGTTSATTSTGTQVFDTGVYLDTTAGMLTATTFKGALSGNATTATTATKANQLTTARTFTIGAASDTFNGTDNVSFDLDDIGAASASVVNAKFTSVEADIQTLFANINQQGEVTSVKTTQGWTFNNNGMNIGTTSTFNTAITTSGATFKNGSTTVTQIDGSGLTATTINNQGAYQYGYADGAYLFKDELITIDGEYAVATFYNGT